MNGHQRILILEDDAVVASSLRDSLGSQGYQVALAANAQQAQQEMSKHPADLLLLDIALPGAPRGGLEYLHQLRATQPRLPVVVVSGKDSKANLLEAGGLGARQFLTKGEFGEQELFDVVAQALQGLECEVQDGTVGVERLLGRSRVMRILRALIQRFAPLDMPVLIHGPTGSGKELVACALHEEAPARMGRPLVVVNCAAMPESIMESHLFGHRRGAFTGAIEDHPGLIQQAQGSTLFLDEVGELSLAAQQRFLRFLESGQIQAVGGRQSSQVQVRVVTASHQDLMKRVEAGRFREDLWFRLNVLNLTVPPLREREEDIELLAGQFLRAAADRNQLPRRQLTAAALERLCRYDWPGNVRELRNMMERLMAGAEHPSVEEAEIRQLLPVQVDGGPASSLPPATVAPPTSRLSDQPGTAGKFPQTVEEIQPLRQWRMQQQQEYVKRVMQLCQGNVTRAAELLDVDRSTIYAHLNS